MIGELLAFVGLAAAVAVVGLAAGILVGRQLARRADGGLAATPATGPAANGNEPAGAPPPEEANRA